MARGPRLIVWLVAVGLVATACAGGGSAEDLLRESGTRPDQEFLVLAEDELTKRCMERAGFRFVTIPPDQLPVEPKSYQWGRDDVEAARKRGYGLSEKDPFQGFLDPNAEYKKSLSRSERERYGVTLSGHWENRIEFTLADGTTFSISGDGCVAEARKKIYGDLRRYMQLTLAVTQVAPEVDRRVASDRAYLRALESWRECMGRRGYDFGSPGDAIQAASAAYRSEGDAAAARAQEIRIAVADAECGAESGLVRVATRLEREYTSRVLSEREGQVIAYREFIAEAVTRAKRLLG